MASKNNKCGISVKMLPGESRKQYLARWQKAYRDANREKLKAFWANDRIVNADRHRKNKQNYFIRNKESIYSRNKKWAEKNKERRAEYMRAYRAKNKERLRRLNRLWIENNYETYRASSREYQNERLKNDAIYKLVHMARLRMRCALKVKSCKKLHSTHELIGCTPHKFKAHLESMFDSNMNWENYGDYWVVDHMVPISSFDLSKSEEQKKAFHYTNCQPLSCEDNNFKADKLPSELDRYYTDPFYRREIVNGVKPCFGKSAT